MDKKSRQMGGGSKLNRSEVVTIRLDPKLRFAAELGARKHRRTVSSFIEWCIEVAMDVHVDFRDPRPGSPPGVAYVCGTIGADLVWDVDPTERFVKLALAFPDLLSYDESILWKLIYSALQYWKTTEAKTLENARMDLIKKDWESLKQKAGRMSTAELFKLKPRMKFE